MYTKKVECTKIHGPCIDVFGSDQSAGKSKCPLFHLVTSLSELLARVPCLSASDACINVHERP
jgi:hypothetical protein